MEKSDGDTYPLKVDAPGKRYRSPLFIHFLMVVAATLVSSSFIVGAEIASSLDPVLLTLIRFFLAACLFAPWVHYHHGFGFSSGLFVRCALISGCLALFFCSMFLALRYTTALNTSVLFALVPSISGFYAFFLNRERLRREQFFALGCGLVGVIWVIFRGDINSMMTMQWNRGDLIFLVGCFAIGLYAPLVKRLHREEPMAVMTFWVLVTGTLWLLIFGAKQCIVADWQAIPFFVWGSLFYLSVFTTIVTFFLTQYSVAVLGPTKVTAYSYLYPGLLILLNLALGRGLPPLHVVPGVLLILVAMLVLQMTKESV